MRIERAGETGPPGSPGCVVCITVNSVCILGARWNLGVRFGLIRTVSTRRAGQSCIDPPFWAEPLLAPPGWPRARWRKELRADRDPTANARSPPDQMDCFSSPAPRWLLGSRTVVLLALLVIYNDETTYYLPTLLPRPGGASRGHDVHAGYSSGAGGTWEALPGLLGYRVVHFWLNRADRQTSRPRLGSTVWALALRRGSVA